MGAPARWGAAVVVVGLVAGGAVALSRGPAQRVALTSGVDQAGAVPWAPLPFSAYQAPVGPSATPAPSSARPCSVSEVRATLGDRDGATGHLLHVVRFRSTARSVCVLKGYPQVRVSDDGRSGVRATDGSFFPVPPTADLQPGQEALLGVETDSACPAWPGGSPDGEVLHRLDVTLPGSGTLTVPDPTGLDVLCGAHLTPFYVEQPDPAPPHDPLSDLQVALEVPDHVAAGSDLAYVVDLRNPTDRPVPLDRCPGYVETAGPVKDVHGLSCGTVGAVPAHGAVRFAMRLRLPAGLAAGTAAVHWSLATPFPVTGGATVTVTRP
ncbi:MAG: DUF4232 domain-containing protein [Nocardioidaceae bacterium]